MRKTIDYTYTDVSDNQEGDHLFGVSTRTVKKAITRLEERYFQGRNIFRSKGDGSDFLFRYEIKNLLLLLVRLELDDVFADSKSKDNGISLANMDKLLNEYEYITDPECLREYEDVVLHQSFNAEESVDFLYTIDNFQKAMTNLIVLFSKYYNLFSSDYFKKIVYVINSISRTIVWAANGHILENHIEKYQKDNLSYAAGPENRKKRLSLDLRNAVVEAINTIADEIYSFDEAGVCTRKTQLSYEFDSSTFTEICMSHMNEELSGKQSRQEMSAKEIEAESAKTVEQVRVEIDDFMNAYWNFIYPSEGFSVYSNKPSTIIDSEFNKLVPKFTNYIMLHCMIKHVFFGGASLEDAKNAFKVQSSGALFEDYERCRDELCKLKASDHYFGTMLKNLEDEAWAITNLKRGIFIDDMLQLVKKHLNAYQEKTNKWRYLAQDELEKIESGKFEGTPLEGISDNINLLQKQLEEQMKNMLSMILKLEADELNARRNEDE